MASDQGHRAGDTPGAKALLPLQPKLCTAAPGASLGDLVLPFPVHTLNACNGTSLRAPPVAE